MSFKVEPHARDASTTKATIASTHLCEDAATSAGNLCSNEDNEMLRMCANSGINYGHRDYGIRRQFEFR